MTPSHPADDARWTVVQRIFHDLVVLPQAERPAALATACGGDAALQDAVQRLLDADTTPSVLDRATGEVAETLLEAPEPGELAGTRLGPYRLTSKLGEGGSGVVYLAERDDIGSTVAIKVLRDAWVSPSRRERFLDEQRTLAKLGHPGIGRIFDAGVEHGAPWFAMEYVQGLPLDEYCRHQVTDVIGRIRLMIRVADAVQYAHERLFVHRDLKPSNILVLPDGEPKLLDFGIAQHLNRLEASRLDAGPIRFLSEAYAAPEEMRGELSGVQADVYSLGVILRDLVTECRAFDTRANAGDLTRVCDAATAVDTTERYATVDRLRRDLVAFVGRRPVKAHPPSWTYRTRLWMARHRRAVAAAAVLAVVLGGLGGYYAQRLATARAQTRAEAARSARLLQFVIGLFEGDGADGEAPTDLRVIAMLRRGVEEAEGLAGDPEAQADLRQTLGRISHEVGDLAQADRLLSEALAHRRARATDLADLVGALADLGTLRLDQARLDDSERLVAEALAIATRELPPTHPRRLRAQVLLGRLRRDQGAYAEAATILSGAIARHEAAPADGVDLAQALLALAETQFYAGDIDAADASNARALRISRQVEGERHPDVGHALLNRAAIAAARNDVTAAEQADREALDIFTKWYGDAHPETASARTMLAQALGNQGRHDEALVLLRQAAVAQERTFGPIHPRTAFVQNEIGMVLFRLNDLPAAAVAFARAAEGYGAPSGRHFQHGVSVSNLGSVYLAQGDDRRAEAALSQALTIYAEALPADHLNIAIARGKLGRALLRQQRHTEATPHLAAAAEVLERQPGAPSSWLQAAREDLAALAAVQPARQ